MNDCWLWRGHSDADGYGKIARWNGKRQVRAHRALYEAATGRTLPPDVILHHLCCTRLCVNPAHLVETTRAEHDDAAPNWQSRKTHCPHGHPYDDDNTGVVVRTNGQRSRICRACRREQRSGAKEVRP